MMGKEGESCMRARGDEGGGIFIQIEGDEYFSRPREGGREEGRKKERNSPKERERGLHRLTSEHHRQATRE